MTRYAPCMCGATDCPSCGPAQGYEVIRVYDPKTRSWSWRNPEDTEEEPPEDFADTEGDGFVEDGGSWPFPEGK